MLDKIVLCELARLARLHVIKNARELMNVSRHDWDDANALEDFAHLGVRDALGHIMCAKLFSAISQPQEAREDLRQAMCMARMLKADPESRRYILERMPGGSHEEAFDPCEYALELAWSLREAAFWAMMAGWRTDGRGWLPATAETGRTWARLTRQS